MSRFDLPSYNPMDPIEKSMKGVNGFLSNMTEQLNFQSEQNELDAMKVQEQINGAMGKTSELSEQVNARAARLEERCEVMEANIKDLSRRLTDETSARQNADNALARDIQSLQSSLSSFSSSVSSSISSINSYLENLNSRVSALESK